ncbi:histidine kinase [Cellulomonas bogoriensis 69B4 = DSM 16987]|uniref:Sensor histidine kinase MtrB n=2 Tax=Cellulomonas bogoriensis TaxID=301388 RepID=A0A0A0BPY0_9CELL|nr:histidine kinase [Cellulomonas bogoriensis 69B4 = DSM 16987]
MLRLALRARHLARRGWYRWRASLQVKVVTSTLVVGIVTVGALGGYVSDRVRDGLFDERLGQVLEESGQLTSLAQSQFDASSAVTGPAVQELFGTLVPMLHGAGTSRPEVFLRRSTGTPGLAGVSDVSTRPELDGIISTEMREAVRGSDVHRWTPVAVPQQDAGAWSPGVLVGSLVSVPAAGTYELYTLYDLAPQQATLEFVQRTLAVAGLVLLGLLGAMTWMVARQTVRPVRAAADVAERLAEGNLEERMTVHGVDEMATLARSFNEMAESLHDQINRMETLSHLQRRFVSDVSHELRTPLTTIRMAAEVINDGRDGLDPSARRSAELLTTQLDRFEALLADLLEISRFDAGAAMLDAESRDLRDVVTGVLEQAVALAARRGVWLAVDTPERPVMADVDPRRVERVLRNLVVNAIEHAEGRPVEIRLAGAPQSVAVTVRDHGVGMTAEEAAHVFDRFWRADPARARTTGGTGLGLAISIEDAHLHGGWLEAWGRPGQGACFRLTLPRRAGITLESSPLPLEPEDATGPVAPGRDPASPGTDPAAVPDLDRLEA